MDKEKSSFVFWLMLAIFIVSVGIATKKEPKQIEHEKIDHQPTEETLELL